MYNFVQKNTVCECIYVYNIYKPVFVYVAVSVCILYEYIFNFEWITKDNDYRW